MSFDLSHDTVDSADMICGGQANVLLDCVSPTPINRAIFERWHQMRVERQKGSLLTVLIGSENQPGDAVHCLLTAAGGMIGDIPLPEVERKQVLATAADLSAVHTLAFDGGISRLGYR